MSCHVSQLWQISQQVWQELRRSRWLPKVEIRECSSSFRKFCGVEMGRIFVSIRFRMILTLFILVIIPEAITLYLLEVDGIVRPESVIAAHLAIALAMLGPVSRLCCYLVVGRDIAELYAFCLAIKHGNYDISFALPNEQEDEAEIIKLKRTLNWMAHSLFMRDRSQRQKIVKNEELKRHYERLSEKDELTGLYNRRFFNAKLSMYVSNALQSGEKLCLMMIDVDNFKEVNDSLGHLEGDELLQKLGGILNRSSRSGIDIPFRYGGDEFGVILPGIDSVAGYTIGCRIKQNFARIAPAMTSLSIGIATLCHDYDDASTAREELIKVTDGCVYEAKRSGRDSVVVENSGLTSSGPELRKEDTGA